MNRELLEKPFSPDQIRQREGSFGKMLDYVEGHAVIQRLNDAFEADWSFEIVKHQILTDTNEVIVLGKLIAGDIVKSQFGSSQITIAKESGKVLSLADDLKAAATDSLKKCATMLGVGLHLYAGDKPANPNPNRPNTNYTQTASGGNGSGNRQGNNGNGRISAKQHKFILDLMKEAGMTKKELDDMCVEAYGSVVNYLNKNDASNVIEMLRAR